jgi:glucose/arabinose dehydrogenase
MRASAAAIAGSLLIYFFAPLQVQAEQQPPAAAFGFESEGMIIYLENVVRTDAVIWALDFIGADTMIFTERTGAIKLLHLKTREVTEVTGGPQVFQSTSGGLFDVLVDPDFAENGFLFFTYVKPVDAGSVTAVARGRLDGEEIMALHDVFVANNASAEHAHWGSRLVMDDRRCLFVTVGDRHVPANAQDLMSHGGKVLRIRDDGTVPDGNPFAGAPDMLPEIWSIGHRNPQGLAIHPLTGALFEQEHGPTGGDEINIIEPGKNYGWPVITHGENIWGGLLPEGTAKGGMEQPLVYFKPGIAPSGMTFYFGDRYPHWDGDLFSSTLRGHINRLVLENTDVVRQERLLKDFWDRVRDIAQGPDGLLYISTESGRIIRLVPVN